MPMSYVQPPECAFPQLCRPNGDYFPELVLTDYVGPYNKHHKIRTDYTVYVAGTPIPIVHTIRDFDVTLSVDYGIPNRLLAFRQQAGTTWVECEERPADKWISRVIEYCTIKKSRLHYLDQSNGVCLYSTREQHFSFEVTGRTSPTKFKETFGDNLYHKVIIKKQDLNGYITETWNLLIDGNVNTLDAVTVNWTPSFQIAGGKIWTAGWEPDPNVVQGLVFPQPPSKGICTEDEISYYGFYDYSNDGEPDGSVLNRLDGGCMDFYYPDWCRQMQEDPFWKYAAYRRFMLSWYRDDATINNKYTPPPIAVDPLPKGTFVRHPLVGDVYQWLLETLDNKKKVFTSQNFNSSIITALPENVNFSDTTLYYPIGVI